MKIDQHPGFILICVEDYRSLLRQLNPRKCTKNWLTTYQGTKNQEQAYMHLIQDDFPEEVVRLGVFEGESLLRQPRRQLNVVPRDSQMDQGRGVRGVSFESETEEDEEEGEQQVGKEGKQKMEEEEKEKVWGEWVRDEGKEMIKEEEKEKVRGEWVREASKEKMEEEE